MLDASFNVGGDTVVLPGHAADYAATLSGSFVTIAGGDISIAIPVGVAGLSVEFADGARSLTTQKCNDKKWLAPDHGHHYRPNLVRD